MADGELPARRSDAEGSSRGRTPRIGLVLTGGGARAAYQVGLVRHLAARMPEFRFDVLTGVSAGAINASFLGSHQGNVAEATDALGRIWLDLTPNHVFQDDGWSLGKIVVRWLLNLTSGGLRYRPEVRGLVDSSPLTRHLASPDLLSLLMFQPDYIRALIEVGERDAEARHEEIAALISGATRS